VCPVACPFKSGRWDVERGWCIVHIVKLTPEQLEHLDQAIGYAQGNSLAFHAAYDETDKSIKFKVGNMSWTPPLKTEEW
jgi:hypothetical protein